MTEEKTLGEIGHEAYLLRYDAIPGVPFNPSKEKLASCWEAAASAVREKVIEECAAEDYIVMQDAEIASLRIALKRAADMLHSIAGDIEDGYSLDSMRGKYVLAVLGARDAARDGLRAPPRREGDRTAHPNEQTVLKQ